MSDRSELQEQCGATRTINKSSTPLAATRNERMVRAAQAEMPGGESGVPAAASEDAIGELEDALAAAQCLARREGERKDKAREHLNELLSAYKVWKNATESRCRLLSRREASDTMLFPDRAFMDVADRIRGELEGEK